MQQALLRPNLTMKLLNQSCRKQILGSVRKKSAGAVRREVWVSSSSCIFANLALEDLLYRRGGFQDRELVLLYRNRPCVVIGSATAPSLDALLTLVLACPERS